MAELIYGKNTIFETLKSGHKILEVYISDQVLKSETKLIDLVKKNNIKMTVMTKQDLNNMTSGNHQGVIAKIEDYKYYELSDILESAKAKEEEPFIVILDGLEDPHNLGAILRTAEAAGVHGVVIPKNRSVGLNATVAKLSTGAIEYVKVAKVTNINQTIKDLKALGIWIYGTDVATRSRYTEADYTGPTAIVIGNEGKGISRLVKENSDLLVKIPMQGKIQSLNASVSASILMYEVVRQRKI